MSITLCISFLFFSSTASADIPPPQEPAATADEKTNNEVGVKGAWADSVKTEFLTSCKSSRPETISATEMNKICTCSLSSLEKLYSPQELGTPEAVKKSEEVGATCAMGTKGAWASFIKQQFMQGCESSKPEGITATAMKNICACSMSMIEVKFGPEKLQTKEAASFSEKAVEVCATQELNK